MNASVYIFGEFNSGYSQYPDDYASSIFRNFSANAKSTTQIAIHRDGNLMYYGYIRKLQQDRYLGLCVVLNGLMLKRIDGLFTLFENTISNLVTNGQLIHFDEQGNLVTRVEQLYLNREEIDLLTESLRAGFSKFNQYCTTLPAVNYGTAKNSSKDFVINNEQDDIIKSSYTNGYTFIYKSSGYNTAKLDNYAAVLKNLHKSKCELIKKCESLESDLKKETRKKQNAKWVGLLSVIVGILFVILYYKVINPSEVTHYETGDFVYYGPLKDKRPHGIGVAIYPDSDPMGRKYYIGRFDNGKRQDSTAILFYNDGDYYYGSMNEDEWSNGIIFMFNNKSHFVGSFKGNEPYTGTWYYHNIGYGIVKGEKSDSVARFHFPQELDLSIDKGKLPNDDL